MTDKDVITQHNDLCTIVMKTGQVFLIEADSFTVLDTDGNLPTAIFGRAGWTGFLTLYNYGVHVAMFRIDDVIAYIPAKNWIKEEESNDQ